MCGIFGYIGTKSESAKVVLHGLKQLEYRGYDSWGVAVIPEAEQGTTRSQIIVKKRVGKIGDATVDELPNGTIAFGHTRWATHGGVTEVNSHPHLDCSGQIAIIHNGIVENFASLKQQLMQRGHRFVSETDSEVIAHLIEEKMKKASFPEAVRRTMNDLAGLNAVIAMHTADRMLVAARNGSPLVLGFGVNENYLASDPAALLEHTKEVYFLEDQEIAIVTADEIHVSQIATGQEKVIHPQHLDWENVDAQKGEYRYFMEKEIYEQPKIIASIAAAESTHHIDVARRILAAETTCLIGCGTAAHAGQVGAYLFAQIAHHSVQWVTGSEFSNASHFLTKNSVMLALSQSGETMDLLEPLKQMQQQGVGSIALVNVLGSSLYRMADDKILIGAGPEKAVASTKAFTGKIAHLVLLAYAMIDRLEDGKAVVAQAAASVQHVLAPTSVEIIQTLAHQLKNVRDLYVLGRGISYPLSLEAALKIKEVSYIHAEGVAAGELKHGTLALIEHGTACMVFLPDDETYMATLSGAMEVKARGGYIIGVSSKRHDIFDVYIEVPDAKEATIIPNVVVAQVLAYSLTLERGFDPDMPRNLAKSVTVK